MWKLRAILFTAPAIVISTIIMGTLSAVASIGDRTGATQHRIAGAWGRILLAVSFVRVRVHGLEKLDPARGYVLVMNHASYMDTPAILGKIPLPLRFFAKQELFSIPFMGWHLGRAGHVAVPRDDIRASLKSMTEGAKMLKERGLSVVLFPEGGRTEKQMRLFKEGAAFIAIKAGVPAVPVGLRGTRKILPMHSWMIRSGTIDVMIGDPVETSGMTSQDRGKLNTMLQDKVSEMVGEVPVESA